VNELSGDEMVALFKQHLKVLSEGRNAIWAHIRASREMIEQSRALIVQIDEQIKRIERELGWFEGLPPAQAGVANAARLYGSPAS
jgi:hypothetical protein